MVNVAEKNLAIKEILSWAEGYLNGYGVADPKAEAEYMLSHVLGCKRAELYLNYANHLPYHVLQEFVNFVERRIKREPSQYIIGEQEFWGLPFKVTPNVLIPRPETEILVEEAVRLGCGMWDVGCGKNLPPTPYLPHPVILDLCTGSGCIAVSLAKELPHSRIYATDVSEKALDVAQENAERNGVADKITFLNGNLFEPLRGLNLKADLIVSNPPYISKNMMKELQPEVKDYEPVTALYGGKDGLDFYRRIIAEAPKYLSKDGCILLEIGYGQAEKIKTIIEQNNAFKDISIIKDFAGIDRVIKAQTKN